MKTIEERADVYVGHPFEIDEFSSTSIKRQAFIDGAKEQRKTDIEKVCEWLCKCCPAQLDRENDFSGCKGNKDSCCPTLESLINAMRE